MSVDEGQRHVDGAEDHPLESQQRQQQRQKEGVEEEEEEEEDDEDDEDVEEGGEWGTLAAAADGAEYEASRENDGFLEDFAKELDGASSCGEEEEEEEEEEDGNRGEAERPERKREREEDDEQVAYALQVRSWCFFFSAPARQFLIATSSQVEGHRQH